MIKVTLADGVSAGYCAKGVVAAVREAGLDWRKLSRKAGGIPLEDWLTIDDAQFKRVALVAQTRAKNVQG